MDIYQILVYSGVKWNEIGKIRTKNIVLRMKEIQESHSKNRMRNTAGHNNLYNKHVHEFIIHIPGEGMQDNISKPTPVVSLLQVTSFLVVKTGAIKRI